MTLMPNAKPELQIRQATEEDIPVLRELFDAGVYEGEV